MWLFSAAGMIALALLAVAPLIRLARGLPPILKGAGAPKPFQGDPAKILRPPAIGRIERKADTEAGASLCRPLCGGCPDGG